MGFSGWFYSRKGRAESDRVHEEFCAGETGFTRARWGQGRRWAGRRLGRAKRARFPESGAGGRPRQARLIDDRSRAGYGGPEPERFIMDFWIRAIRGASARVDGPWQWPDLTLPPKLPVWSQAREVADGRSRRLGGFLFARCWTGKSISWFGRTKPAPGASAVIPRGRKTGPARRLLRTADGRCAPPMEDTERRWKMRSASSCPSAREPVLARRQR